MPNATYNGWVLFIGADIIINTVGAADAEDAAEAIVEELGHAYNMALPMGRSSIVNDNPLVSGTYDFNGTEVSAGAYNYLLITDTYEKKQ